MIRGIHLIVFGVLLLMTPNLIGGFGDDAFEHLIARLPLQKWFLLRAMTITGLLFIMTGCVIS